MVSTSEHFHVPFRRNMHFVGRDDDLDRIHHFLWNKASSDSKPVGLTGMSGIGKTQLAVEYAYRYKDYYPGGVFWLNASSSLEKEFAGLGTLFGEISSELTLKRKLLVRLTDYFNKSELKTLCFNLGVNYEDLPSGGRSDKARELLSFMARNERLNKLEQAINEERPFLNQEDEEYAKIENFLELAFTYFKTNPKSLIIIDDLVEPSSLQKPLILDNILIQLPIAILFTTRYRQLDGCHQIDLQVLLEKYALQLLLRHPSRQQILVDGHPQQDHAKNICQVLGYLPLALEAAGSQLGKKPATNLVYYLKTLRNRGALTVIESKHLPAKITHEKGIRAILTDQWESLPSDEARTILKIASLMPETSIIPKNRLGLFAGISEMVEDFLIDTSLSEAVHQLVNASFIESLPSDHIRLHPLVRDFVSQQIPSGQLYEFIYFCAKNLARSYKKLSVLETQWMERGIDAILEDIEIVFDFLSLGKTLEGNIEKKFKVVDGTDNLISYLTLLQKVLKSESKNLRVRFDQCLPSHFVQQLIFRAWDLGSKSLSEAGINYLLKRGLGAIQCRWAAKNELTVESSRFDGHSDWVSSIVVTSDQQMAISASWDKTIKVWNLKTGLEEKTLSGHDGIVLGVAVTNEEIIENQRVISASGDKTLKVWNLHKGEVERTLSGHHSMVQSVALTSNNEQVVSASTDKTLKVWDLETGKVKKTLIGHSDWVWSVAVTNLENTETSLAVSASDDKLLKIWNLNTGMEVRTLYGHSDKVRAVALSSGWRHADRVRIMSGSQDMTVKIWDLLKGFEERNLFDHSKSVNTVAVSKDGRMGISASGDKTLKVWNLDSGEQLASITLKAAINCVALSSDNQTILTGDTSGSIYCFRYVVPEKST